ncbi:hypothetical protein Gohar_006867 [Gossypium harknessii]|uniref:Uncharacterized protein n=1 Tax=Gossypium harknessii TaxID=34285 RepID=A0A7J9GES1_9ROSI|nr:hypothetical protein [Gossypium harknessii]
MDNIINFLTEDRGIWKYREVPISQYPFIKKSRYVSVNGFIRTREDALVAKRIGTSDNKKQQLHQLHHKGLHKLNKTLVKEGEDEENDGSEEMDEEDD